MGEENERELCLLPAPWNPADSKRNTEWRTSEAEKMCCLESLFLGFIFFVFCKITPEKSSNASAKRGLL